MVLAVAALAGCATDSIPNNGAEEREDPNACANPCGAGETRCNGDTIEACAADARGCFDWVAGVDCAADATQCDDSAEPAICLTEPGTCQDGAVNQDESDADCGGSRCEPCALGRTCLAAADCTTNNCDLGNTNACVPEDQPTCTDGAKNQDETDVDCGGTICAGCGENAACAADTDCESGTCDGDKCTAPDPNTGCNPGEVRCTGNTVQTCDQNQWVETQICAQACAAGACADDVQCTPGANRCFKNSVQTCNVAGSAWQHLDICEEDCMNGLCVGACEPTALRCNGDVQEMCGMDGQTWAQNEACALGCDHRVCIEQELTNKGVPMTLSGTHVYKDCVNVELGGTIDVPADETLEIWAKCLKVTQSSSINLGSGARFIFHATETILNEGTISGGSFVRLDAYKSLTNSGDVSSSRVELRGDVLSNSATGTIGGSDSYALYGSSFTNDGTHSGVESVMPPETLSSPTHPEGYQWNMADDDVSIAWDKPFATVKGYYVAVNSAELPGPGVGEFTTQENVTLPLSAFRPGQNRVDIVSVNDDSTVGTVPATFEIDFNVTAPTVSSSSHGDPFEWASSDDIFLEWQDAPTVDTESYVGYWYAWDHRGDTKPRQNQGTFRNDTKILMNDQAPGVWNFHIVSIDRLGRTSPVPSRYEVRVGPSPGFGNVAGTVTDAAGKPIRGASVTLNGGVYRATSVASGDYTFRGEVPAAAFDWEVAVSAPGYTPQTTTVRMTPNRMEVMDFQLQPSNVPPSYQLGFEIALSDYNVSTSVQPDVAMGRPGEVIWSHNSRMGITTTTGTRLLNLSPYAQYEARLDVGWDGGHYFLAHTSRCGSYTNCPAVKFWDATHDEVGSASISGWSDAYGPSLVWDSSAFVLVAHGGYDSRIGTVDPLDPASSTYASTYASSGSSNVRSAALYDGSAIAIVQNVYFNDDYQAVFSRYSRDGTEIQAPVAVGVTRYALPVGLAFDGTKYHVTYKGSEAKPNGEYPFFIRNVDAAGNLSMPTELESDPSSYRSVAAVSFDGRNLLIAYEVDGHGYLEVRSPADYAIVDTFDLGAAQNLNVDFGYHVGAGAVVYQRPDVSGLFMREIVVR